MAKQQTPQGGARQLRLSHIEAMDDNGYEKNDLPTEIKKKLTMLDALQARYKSKPTENLALSIEKQSVSIADMIQTFSEKEIEEENGQKEAAEKEAAEKLAAENKAKLEQEAAEKEEAERIAAEAKVKEDQEKADAEATAKLEEAERIEAERKEREGAFGNQFIKGYTGR